MSVSLPDIRAFQRRHEELGARMAAPDFYGNPRDAALVTREHQRLGELLETHARLGETLRAIRDNEELARGRGTDAELAEMAEAELPALRERAEALEKALRLALLPPDPSDSRDTILEIRAGTGGEEAALFAGVLFRMYSRYADACGWSVQPLGSSPSERGGFKEVIFMVRGESVYRALKFESGVHRVQRVPETEANGRIHTSTVTVAVLPEAEEVDVHIDPQDIEISVARASGPGGQGVNTTDSAVQILHKPTGMIVCCSDERSQIKNRARALTVLRSRLLKQKEEEERAKYAAHRREQIGTGDRSERIRTYNFPQSRLTDHRIGLTLYNLPDIVEGALEPVIDALHAADQEARLRALNPGGGVA